MYDWFTNDILHFIMTKKYCILDKYSEQSIFYAFTCHQFVEGTDEPSYNGP